MAKSAKASTITDQVAGQVSGANEPGGGVDVLLKNLRRHVHAPRLLQRRSDYRLEIYARHGPHAAAHIALPFVATGSASLPIPGIGCVGLDPTTILTPEELIRTILLSLLLIMSTLLLVDRAFEDQAMQILQRPAPVAKLHRQPVEKLGMTR